MTLNKKQKEAYEMILSPDNSGEIMMLIGAGGTGKTYTLSQTVHNYEGHVAVTALTHKAKKVLQEAGIPEVSTIHSFLNLLMVRSGYNMKLVHNSKNKMKTTGLLIVDEVSQLTGFMYKLLEQGIQDGLYDRVVLVGDSTQLPSVGDIVDLSKKGLQTVELTQQMRQDPTKLELQTYLNKLRDSISTGAELDVSNPPPEVVYIDNFKDFAKEYVECKSSKIILAHRNRCIDSYNSNIASNSKFLENDVVVLDKPWGGFNNQDTLAIHSVEEEEDRYCIKFFEDTPAVFHYKSDSAMNIVLDKYVNAEDEEGYWALKDRCFKLKHLYAQTVFKSQGSSYSTVFLDGTDIETAHTQDKTKYNHPISHDLMLRLFYVGISRMRTKCYIFTGGARDYKQLKRKWA